MKGASVETVKAVMDIVGFCVVGIRVGRTNGEMAVEVVRRINAMCDRCPRTEPTADYRNCPGACPGTEWKDQ